MPKGNAANCGVLTNAFVLATKSDPNAHETVVSHIVEREARPNHMIGCQALTPWDKRILASNVSGARRNLLVLPALFQNNIAPIPGSSAAQNGGHVCF